PRTAGRRVVRSKQPLSTTTKCPTPSPPTLLTSQANVGDEQVYGLGLDLLAAEAEDLPVVPAEPPVLAQVEGEFLVAQMGPHPPQVRVQLVLRKVGQVVERDHHFAVLYDVHEIDAKRRGRGRRGIRQGRRYPVHPHEGEERWLPQQALEVSLASTGEGELVLLPVHKAFEERQLDGMILADQIGKALHPHVV